MLILRLISGIQFLNQDTSVRNPENFLPYHFSHLHRMGINNYPEETWAGSAALPETGRGCIVQSTLRKPSTEHGLVRKFVGFLKYKSGSQVFAIA